MVGAAAEPIDVTDVTPTITHPCWKQEHEENVRRNELPECIRKSGANVDADAGCRADAIATECRNRLIESIRNTMQQVVLGTNGAQPNNRDRKLGLLLSGGVDSTAILEAAKSINATLDAAVTVVIVEDGDDNANRRRKPPEDELYATEAARLYNEDHPCNEPTPMTHSIVRLTPAQLIKKYSKPTIQTLALWGSMDTRNSLIISAAFHECQTLGITDVLVGDNADELFGGSYDVMMNKTYLNDPDGWKMKRDGMADLPFVTQKLAETYGITVHAPFMDREFIEWAVRECQQGDCVAYNRRIQSSFGGPFEEQPCGKLPIREAFSTVASWRRMDFIYRGSGASEGRIIEEFYETSVSDDEFSFIQNDFQTYMNVRLKSKEHLYNMRIYHSVFCDIDGGARDAVNGGLVNVPTLVHPTKHRYPPGDVRGCISCGFEIGTENFCHLCDEYPAQHPHKQT